LVNKGTCFEISTYQGGLSAKNVIKNIAKIKIAFSNLPIEFYDLLNTRIKEKGFSDEQFRDAVNHVIDTCVYPQPTIAQFLSFDKKVELFTYEQMLKKNDEQRGIMRYYTSVEINGGRLFVSNENFKKYPFKKWIAPTQRI